MQVIMEQGQYHYTDVIINGVFLAALKMDRPARVSSFH